MKISASHHAVLRNIRRFEQELKESSQLQDRLPYARAWYADRDENGRWRFGPSKFIGYEDLDADSYVETSEILNGRRTEAQLRQWFVTVDPKSELGEELSDALSDFLGQFDKAPSTKARINILNDVYRDGRTDQNDAFIDLVLALAKMLPKKQVSRLKEGLRYLT